MVHLAIMSKMHLNGKIQAPFTKNVTLSYKKVGPKRYSSTRANQSYWFSDSY